MIYVHVELIVCAYEYLWLACVYVCVCACVRHTLVSQALVILIKYVPDGTHRILDELAKTAVCVCVSVVPSNENSACCENNAVINIINYTEYKRIERICFRGLKVKRCCAGEYILCRYSSQHHSKTCSGKSH